MNHFLKAADAAELQSVLVEAGIIVFHLASTDQTTGTVVEPAGMKVRSEFSLDTIGTISKPTGAMLSVDGAAVPEMAAIPGWHANLLGDLTDEQRAILGPILLDVAPAKPFRVWMS